MKKFIFISGGARSGKSTYAVKTAKSLTKKVAFIATCIPQDSEMQKRIKLHKSSRPKHWTVIEEGVNIDVVLSGLGNKYDLVLVDCLGLFISNLLMKNLKDNEIKKKTLVVLEAIASAECHVIVVSNDVGSGIVPDNPLARRFRDCLGLANQLMAKKADEVIIMHAGIPVKIK